MEITLRELNAARLGWRQLANVPKAPKVAHKIMKYLKSNIDPELKIIAEYQESLIKELANNEEGDPEGIVPETPEHKEFIKRWDEFLDTKIKVKRCSTITMDKLIDGICVNKETVISEAMLMSIEDFFKSK